MGALGGFKPNNAAHPRPDCKKDDVLNGIDLSTLALRAADWKPALPARIAAILAAPENPLDATQRESEVQPKRSQTPSWGSTGCIAGFQPALCKSNRLESVP